MLADDNKILTTIIGRLNSLKKERLVCGVYVVNDFINKANQNVLHFTFEEYYNKRDTMTWPKMDQYQIGEELISILQQMGYKCSKLHCSYGTFLEHILYPNGVYFHVNYQLTFLEKLKYFFNKFILKRKIF